MRYVIYGAGAVGGVIGGRLHAAGEQVVLVARGVHLDALRSSGLRLVTPDGEETHAIPAVGHARDLDLEPEDVVVIATKSQHTAALVDELAAVAPPGVAVACAQNGVANERTALRAFADVYGVCVILPAGHHSPGTVVQYSSPSAGVLDIGRYPSGGDDRAARIAASFEAAGFRSGADPSIMRAKYRKLLMNLSNALDALCGVDARASDFAGRVRDEGSACLAAAGIEVQTAEEEHARRKGGVSMHQVDGHAAHGSSSWQSLARGTGSIEADWLNGEIVLLGRLHGIPTPLNELLQREANRAARERVAPGSMRIADLEALLEHR